MSKFGLEDTPKKYLGNEIICEVVEAYRESDVSLHSPHIFNEYDEIQKIFLAGYDNVRRLLSWKNDNNPETWKWLSPIILESGREIITFDSHNLGFETYAYKGKAAISLMSPELFLQVANHGMDKVYGVEHEEDKSIINLVDRMERCLPIDTPYLDVTDDNCICGHEGRHRAIAAKKVGMSLIPVYIYGVGREINPFLYSDIEWLESARIRNKQGVWIEFGKTLYWKYRRI